MAGDEWLKAKGWHQEPDGSWSPPKRQPRGGGSVGPVEAGRTEQPAIPALAQGKPKRKGGAPGVAVLARVTLVQLRHRRIDRDAVAYSMKPLTDAIAESLGVDDDDHRVEWEWRQAQTDGEEGVLVKIETAN